MKVRITDPKDRYYGQEFDGYLFYHDILHGGTIDGKIQDVYILNINGEEVEYRTWQIDTDYYEKQEIAKWVEYMGGADVGDEVRILEFTAGSFSCGKFSKDDTHIITEIRSSGNVVFDNGAAVLFHPPVEIVKKAEKK